MFLSFILFLQNKIKEPRNKTNPPLIKPFILDNLGAINLDGEEKIKTKRKKTPLKLDIRIRRVRLEYSHEPGRF